MQCWTKVLRRRRGELLSGPLLVTSDTVQRDTSGERTTDVIGVTPHARETPYASSEAHSPAKSTGEVAELGHGFDGVAHVSAFWLTVLHHSFIQVATGSSARRSAKRA